MSNNFIEKETKDDGKEALDGPLRADNVTADNVTTDIVLKMDEHTFLAHKDVLSYHSPVFRDFLKEHKVDVVSIKNFRPRVLRTILTYMYTGQLDVHLQDLIQVHEMARRLGAKEIASKCVQLLLSDDASSLLYGVVCSWQLGRLREAHRALASIAASFESCARSPLFAQMQLPQLCELMAAAALFWPANKSVYPMHKAALSWIQTNNVGSEKSWAVMACVPHDVTRPLIR